MQITDFTLIPILGSGVLGLVVVPKELENAIKETADAYNILIKDAQIPDYLKSLSSYALVTSLQMAGIEIIVVNLN